MLAWLLAQSGSDAYMPHGMCYLWEPDLVWLHVVSDSLTTLAYWAIPPFLIYLALRAREEVPQGSRFARQRLPYDWMFIAFGVFIVACGATHAMGIWTIWAPRYWLEGGIKAVTAVASVATAVALPPLVPRALDLIREARESEVRRVELEEAHEAQQELVRRLQDASEAKSRFLANVSHDLRTPLSLVLGPVEDLLDEDLPEEVRERLRTVRRNARTLGSQVENLLTVATADAGGLEADLQPVDLDPTIREVADHYVAHARGRGIDLQVETPGSLVARVDEGLVKRAVLNLLSNAFRFVPDGGTVRCALRSARDGDVQIVVADSGPGVSEEDRVAIFDRFQQGTASDGRADGGAGLGLAIVREVAEVHGGGVGLDEAPEGGARFTLRLSSPPKAGIASDAPPPAEAGSDGTAPDAAGSDATGTGAAVPGVDGPGTGRGVEDEDGDAIAAPPHPAEEARAARAAGTADATTDAQDERDRTGTSRPTVLLVEDDADMARHLGHVLSADYEVAYAADGREGLEMAVGLGPDLVITDMMMPELDGAGLVDALRERPELADVPILVLTARAEEELPERMLRQGAQDYVLKPVGKGELGARVDNLLQMSGSRRLLQEALESKEQSLERLARMAARRKEELERTVEEKKVLMRELHHRVKGNLQTIISLLQLQLRTVDDERARRSLEESRGRVAAMGLLHERLYRSGAPDRLELASYARSLVSDVVRAGPADSDVRTDLRLEEMEVAVDDAVACGLILHELTTNALRHAFPGGRGTLRVELRREAGDGILVVADDGVGMDAEDGLPAGTLGLELVESLVEQLEGSLEIDTGDGTRVEIVFPLEEVPTSRRADRLSPSRQEPEL